MKKQALAAILTIGATFLTSMPSVAQETALAQKKEPYLEGCLVDYMAALNSNAKFNKKYSKVMDGLALAGTVGGSIAMINGVIRPSKFVLPWVIGQTVPRLISRSIYRGVQERLMDPFHAIVGAVQVASPGVDVYPWTTSDWNKAMDANPADEFNELVERVNRLRKNAGKKPVAGTDIARFVQEKNLSKAFCQPGQSGEVQLYSMDEMAEYVSQKVGNWLKKTEKTNQ